MDHVCCLDPACDLCSPELWSDGSPLAPEWTEADTGLPRGVGVPRVAVSWPREGVTRVRFLGEDGGEDSVDLGRSLTVGGVLEWYREAVRS